MYVYQAANTNACEKDGPTCEGGLTTYGAITAGNIINAYIPYTGGTGTATAGNGTLTVSTTAQTCYCIFSSGEKIQDSYTPAKKETVPIKPSATSYSISAGVNTSTSQKLIGSKSIV